MQQYILAGHSHAGSLGLMSGQGDPELVPVANEAGIELFALAAKDRLPAYWDALVSAAAHRTVVIVWAGNQHLSRFLFAPDPLIDFYLNDNDKVVPGARLVPKSLINRLFDGKAALVKVLLRLREVEGCKVVVCGTPPPKKDGKKYREILQLDKRYGSQAKELNIDLATIPLTPGSIILKMWTMIQAHLKQAAEEGGALFVESPPEARDEDGFLSERFWVHDATHANGVYGKMLLKQIVSSV